MTKEERFDTVFANCEQSPKGAAESLLGLGDAYSELARNAHRAEDMAQTMFQIAYEYEDLLNEIALMPERTSIAIIRRMIDDTFEGILRRSEATAK